MPLRGPEQPEHPYGQSDKSRGERVQEEENEELRGEVMALQRGTGQVTGENRETLENPQMSSSNSQQAATIAA